MLIMLMMTRDYKIIVIRYISKELMSAVLMLMTLMMILMMLIILVIMMLTMTMTLLMLMVMTRDYKIIIVIFCILQLSNYNERIGANSINVDDIDDDIGDDVNDDDNVSIYSSLL